MRRTVTTAAIAKASPRARASANHRIGGARSSARTSSTTSGRGSSIRRASALTSRAPSSAKRLARAGGDELAA